jgi:hypothetical protein
VSDIGGAVPWIVEDGTMKREVLFIPMEEVKKQFSRNSQDVVNIIVPAIMTEELYNSLRDVKKRAEIKLEIPLEDSKWTYSKPDKPNKVCESGDFIDNDLPQNSSGPFAVSFANERAPQDEHVHKQHIEVCFSEHPMNAKYRLKGDSKTRIGALKNGGVIIFGPGVAHKIRLWGTTIVIEIPSLVGDREDAIL